MCGAGHRVRAVQPARTRLSHRGIDEHTTFDSADNRNELPRFTVEARKANQTLVDRLRTIGERKGAPRRSWRLRGSSPVQRGSCRSRGLPRRLDCRRTFAQWPWSSPAPTLPRSTAQRPRSRSWVTGTPRSSSRKRIIDGPHTGAWAAAGRGLSLGSSTSVHVSPSQSTCGRCAVARPAWPVVDGHL